MDIVKLVSKITLFNHNWKRACDQWGANSSIATMLRHRKSDLQIQLLLMGRDTAFLRPDIENVGGEALYSVRLTSPITLDNGIVRADADHMPVRVAEELLTPQDISEFFGS